MDEHLITCDSCSFVWPNLMHIGSVYARLCLL